MEFIKSKIGKRILGISLLAVILIMVSGATILLNNKEGYRQIKVIEVSGKVGVVNQGVEYEAYPGMILREGYTIVTNTDSYVRVVLDDDKYIKIESGSRVIFETLGIIGSGKTTINLERGTIISELVKPLGEKDNYIINTPNAVLAVRGTFFRVGLNVKETGDITTDVQTYGGAVSSQRIRPDGQIIDEDVRIEAGYKTAVKMDQVETIYLVEKTSLQKSDISNSDLIDIYFASENGHEMFITTEELEEELRERVIDIDKYISVYEKAEKIDTPSSVTSPNDGVPVVMEKDNDTAAGVLSDGGHVHQKGTSIIKATCTRDGMQVERCESCEEVFEETVLPATGHMNVVYAGTEDVHTMCTDCGETIEELHTLVDTVVKEPTCTEDGETKYACECGYAYTEVVSALGHVHEVDDQMPGSHIRCAVCGLSLSNTHLYTDRVIKEATCMEAGVRNYSCACGDSYTEEIPKTGHVHEKDGGTAAAHLVCGDCGTILSNRHSYEETVIQWATCDTEGSMMYTCACGYDYSKTVPAKGHTKADEGGSQTTCVDCGTRLIDFNSYNFPDENFRKELNNYNVDANGDGILEGKELDAQKHLTFQYTNISDATGIEHFTELYSLSFLGNPVSYVPCENLSKLEFLSLGWTDVETLDVSAYPDLEDLELIGTPIRSIDVSANTKLRSLNLANCSNITNVDLSNNLLLKHVQLTGTKLVTINIDGYQELEHISLSIDTIEKIRVTNCPKLTQLILPQDRPNVLSLVDVTGCSSLTSLNLEYTTGLVYLYADMSGLSGVLNLGGYTWLQTLSLEMCPGVTGLNLTNCNALTDVILGDGGLAYVQLAGCANLTSLNINNHVYQAGNVQTVDMSGFSGFNTAAVSNVTGGTYSMGVFTFDNGSTSIKYTYDCGNGITVNFEIAKT